MNNPKLYRSLSDRMIAGVCGGLARYFNVDATLVRLVFLILLFLGGGGFLLYIILWIIVPDEGQLGAAPSEVIQSDTRDVILPAPESMPNTGQGMNTPGGNVTQAAARNGPLIFAGILIFLGFWFLLQNLLHIDLGQLWPVILIVIGLALLIPVMRKPSA